MRGGEMWTAIEPGRTHFFFVPGIFLQQKTICPGQSSEPDQLHQLETEINLSQDSKQEKKKPRY
tara:strand:+ start:188 stop:379 length:192 start_codon:yes stop_codon:yes gene_type:complete